MPYKSDKQRRAMHAAAAGNSTIGIPKDVAKKFVSDSQGRMTKALRHDDSNQMQKKQNQGKDKGKYGNYTDPTGYHHTHWKEGKSYGGSNSGGASIGGGAAGGGGG